MNEDQIQLHRTIRININRGKLEPRTGSEMEEVRKARKRVDFLIAELPGPRRNALLLAIARERLHYPHHHEIPSWLKEMSEKLQVTHADSPGSDPYKNTIHAIDLLVRRSIPPTKKIEAIKRMIGDINNVQKDEAEQV